MNWLWGHEIQTSKLNNERKCFVNQKFAKVNI